MTLSSLSGRAKAASCASLLIFIALGCDEDGKTAPETCASPPLEIYDIQDPPTGAGGGSDAENPCVTKAGHAVSPIGGTEAGGSSSTAGRSNGGSANGAGAPGAGADAGGAPDVAEAGAGGA